MSALFTKKELSDHKAQLAKLETSRTKDNFDQYWKQCTALNQAFQVQQVRRAQARAEDYLNALILCVGNQGGSYISFDAAFQPSKEILAAIKKANTPEARRALYTIFKALTEVPKSWGTSAFVRFLRGTGKQKDAKYHGAGTFGPLYGWKEQEIKNICDIITGDRWGGNPYSQVLMSYADMEKEISEAINEDGYEEVDYHAKFYATRVERDVLFLNKLCHTLEQQGLGPVPTPAEQKPKKVRKKKEFQAGDIIRKKYLSDLPLPAHVRIPVLRCDKGSQDWHEATIEQVVTFMTNHGFYHYALVRPGTKKAYPESTYAGKNDLEGATFLGLWQGTILKEKRLQRNFSYRRK